MGVNPNGIKAKIVELKSWSEFWKRDFDRETLHLKLYLSEEWVEKFGEEDAAMAANRAYHAYCEMKRVNMKISDLEELLKTTES